MQPFKRVPARKPRCAKLSLIWWHPRARKRVALTTICTNRPKISASLFEPSYTIASVIANEFTEATQDLYLSALVELGLILFLVTFVVNGIARVLVWNVTRKTSGVGSTG